MSEKSSHFSKSSWRKYLDFFFLGTTVIFGHIFFLQEILLWLLTVTLLNLKNLLNLCTAKLRGRVEPTRVMTEQRCKGS